MESSFFSPRRTFSQSSQRTSSFRNIMDSGNAVYYSATSNRAIEKADTRLALNAHQTYSSALRFAQGDAERASALKNRAKSAYAAAASCEDQHKLVTACIEDLVEAIKLGIASKTGSWVGNLAVFLKDVSQWGLRAQSANCGIGGGYSRSFLERLSFTSDLHPLCRLVICSSLVDFVHKRAVLRGNEHDWVAMRTWCTSYDSMVQQLPSLCDTAWVLDTPAPDEIDLLRTEALGLIASVRVSHCQAQAMLDLLEGKRYLQMLHDEEWDVDIAYAALDAYRMAIVTARGLVVAIEAEARSALGFIFDVILKQEETAHVHYREAVVLAAACAPQSFSSHRWWRKATDFVKRYQERRAAAEEEKRNRAKQPYLDALKNELEELKKHATDGDTLLAYVYKTFKPGGATSPPKDVKKKVLLRTIAHFHPDKCSQMGRKVQVYYEEVCKHLTSAYELTK
eukprot:Rmarinus@m.24889